jgi:pimeloyl-ACP methyl ester carboxylesterase
LYWQRIRAGDSTELLQVGYGRKLFCDISPMDRTVKSLNNKLILLIEADSFLAGYVGDSIIEAGAQILGPARNVDEANTLLGRLRQAPHAAVVSADIFETGGWAMSDALARLGIPLLLIAGRARTLPPSSMTHNVLMAPFAAYQVVDHLRVVLSPAGGEQPIPQAPDPILRMR